MSVSRFKSEAPAAKKPPGRKPKPEDKPQEKSQPSPQAQETPLWEKLAGLVGLLLVLAVLGFLLYEAAQPQSAASITPTVQSVSAQAGGYVVEFQAANGGRQTAASVLVEGSLYAAGAPDEPVETAEMTFDYIPDQSDRTGSLVFTRDPRQYDLRIVVKGYMDP